MSAATLLDRLDKVRPRGPGQWSARCPAHDDRSPSLSIRELPDGRTLVRCFSGCDVEEVTSAVGLEVHDLFPPPTTHASAPRRRALLTAGQALEVLDFEAQLVAIAALNLFHGHALTDDDLIRLSTAASRITAIAAEVRS